MAGSGAADDSPERGTRKGEFPMRNQRTISYVCETCHNPFMGRPASPKRPAARFCSPQCSAASHIRPSLEEALWSRVDKSGGQDNCWLWTAGTTTGGYGEITYKQKGHYAHRTAYELVIGPIPDGMLVCHKCDNRLCCNPEHFFLGSISDNISDMHAKGRAYHALGERHGKAQLTEKQAREIKALMVPAWVYGRRKYTTKVSDVAKAYGVSDATISNLIAGRIWKHLT